MAEASAGQGTPAASADQMPTDPAQGADVKALIAKAVDEATGGLKAKNGELLGSLRSLKDELKRFDGIDPDAMHALLARFDKDEEGKLIAAGKFDEAFAKRTDRMKAAHDKDVAERDARLKAAEDRSSRFASRVLENQIRAEASVAGVHAPAIEDAIYRAQASFHLDDEGNAVARDGVYGKDGVKPLTLKEWFSDMQERAPHWWPAPRGGGAANGSGGAHGAKTMKRPEFEALSPQAKATFMKDRGTVVD